MPLTLIPAGTRIDFIRAKWWAVAFTILAVVLSVGSFATRGFNLGIDFSGGIVIEARTAQAVEMATIREALASVVEGEVSLQNFGDDPRDIMIRVQSSGDQAVVVEQVKQTLGTKVQGEIDYRKVDYVGPQVGGELMNDGALAMALAFAAIMVYVWFRFEWQYGVGAIVALAHDALLTLGFYSITQIEFNLTSIAAVLTIIGYSVNDSVVIYDRIRDNLRKFKKMPIGELINLSVNETLSRTILTVATTFLAALALALFGGDTLKSFSYAMLFGLIVGTYSSVYISALLLDFMNLRANEG